MPNDWLNGALAAAGGVGSAGAANGAGGKGAGFFSKLFNKDSVTGLFKQLGPSLSGGTDAMPTGITSEAEGMNAALGSGITAGLSGLLNFQSINSNKNLTGSQKNMMKADSAVNTLSSLASNIPGVGGAIGGALGTLNKIGGALIGTPDYVKDFKVNDAVASSSGFTGTASQADAMGASAETYQGSGLAGKLFGKKKLKNGINSSNMQQTQVAGILDFNKQRQDQAASSSDLFSATNTNKLYGGDTWNSGSIQYGQKGTKINYKNIVLKAKSKVAKIEKVEPIISEPTVQAFKEGGSMNVIVDGELHARKHGIKELEEFKDVSMTTKGVPVIQVNAEGGAMSQTAEVEKDELILHYDLTCKLEKLCEVGDEDAMIEAGRILAKEIVKNTKDSKSKLLKAE